MTSKKEHPAEGLLAHCLWHSIRLGTKASRPETNGTISWQRQASRASCTTIADAMTNAVRCDGQRTALQHRAEDCGLRRGVPVAAPCCRFAICQNHPSFAHAMPPSLQQNALRNIGHDLYGSAATLRRFRLKPHLLHRLSSVHPRPSDFMAEDDPMPIQGQALAHNIIMYRG